MSGGAVYDRTSGCGGYGVDRDVDGVERRQRQMGIRDRRATGVGREAGRWSLLGPRVDAGVTNPLVWINGLVRRRWLGLIGVER